MRQGPNPKRQRGRGNPRRHGGNPRNQTYESNGPDVKIRGNAHQVLERYLALARDASLSGDRITAENYYQHAEHYYRVLSAQAAAQQNANGGRPGFPGGGPQPELPSVADVPNDEYDDGDNESEGEGYGESGSDHARPNGNGSESPSA
jgi:Domain of unknown function (DUF4167)